MTEVCAHHWLIAQPDGRAALPATCKLCGAQRTFPGWFQEELQYNNNKSIFAPGRRKHEMVTPLDWNLR